MAVALQLESNGEPRGEDRGGPGIQATAIISLFLHQGTTRACHDNRVPIHSPSKRRIKGLPHDGFCARRAGG